MPGIQKIQVEMKGESKIICDKYDQQISLILALRLQKVLPSLIHTNQICWVENKYNGEIL